LAQQQQIELIFKASNPEILVWFDPDLMEKVFFNILSNALKFTSPGGKVEIWVAKDPDGARALVQVRDNGKGIPEDKLPFIFERFFRADEHDEAGGTGIGLSLVKNIVERHHGQVEVESMPGQGTVFNVWLSLDATLFHKEAQKRPTVHGEELRDYLNASMPDPLEYPWGENDPGSPPAAVPDAEKAHVLLVEDNQDIQQYLADCLAPEYTVSTAGNGTEGLAKTLETIPDLILCDISMPGMDGLELTRRLKSHPVTSHIPIILLTARTSLIFKIDGLEMGADDYVTKPFNLRLLQVRIRNLLDSRRRLREKYAHAMTSLLPTPADGAELAFDAIDEQFLQNAAEIVEKNLQNPDFSVDDLAQKLLMNRKQVYRKIKALTGQTPNDYIRNIRLKRAAQLLKTQRYTVAEITYKVGFQDLKYFRERFREVFGVNPSEFESNV
jgi:DNA-binding response OmpR family regulator